MLWTALKVWLLCIVLSGTAVALGRALPGGGVLAVSTATITGAGALSLMDVERGTMRRLVDSDFPATPVWSPDGRWLATVLNIVEPRVVYALDFEHGETHWLSSEATDEALDWSPDSRQLAFVTQHEEEAGIIILDVETGNTRFLSSGSTQVDGLRWSPDGHYLAGWLMQGGDWLIVIEAESGWLQRYLVGMSRRGPSLGANHLAGLAWSPDSRLISFSHNTDGNWELYVLEVNNGELHNLTASRSIDYGGQWSPDGEQIVFGSDRDGNMDIFLLVVDGGEVLNLTRHPAEDILPRWSPDGSQIAFISDRSGSPALYLMDVVGEELRFVSNLSGVMLGLAWRPSPP